MSISKLFIILIFPNFLFSQEKLKIDTDRPDQTECTSTVPKGYFQMENGFTYIDAVSDVNRFFFPSSLWKVGVNERFELRMITETQQAFHHNKAEFGLSPIRFGFKSRLMDAKGAIPNISFIGHLSVPYISTENLRETNFNTDFRFTFDNALSKKISIGYNLGMRWEDENPLPFFQYTCALGYTFNNRWKAYVELFGDKPQNENFELATSGGIYYYPVPNLMFDITAAYGLLNNNLNYYTALGVSFMIPVKSIKK